MIWSQNLCCDLGGEEVPWVLNTFPSTCAVLSNHKQWLAQAMQETFVRAETSKTQSLPNELTV